MSGRYSLTESSSSSNHDHAYCRLHQTFHCPPSITFFPCYDSPGSIHIVIACELIGFIVVLFIVGLIARSLSTTFILVPSLKHSTSRLVSKPSSPELRFGVKSEQQTG